MVVCMIPQEFLGSKPISARLFVEQDTLSPCITGTTQGLTAPF